MWHRVFGRSAIAVSPAKLVEHLASAGVAAVPHFTGDDLGWTRGELHLDRGSPVMLERYLTIEDDLRDDLNAFAAELETLDYNPNNLILMERVIQTQQLMTLRKPVDGPDEIVLDKMLIETCRYLAMNCEGIYQIDGAGWFSANGECLLQEY